MSLPKYLEMRIYNNELFIIPIFLNWESETYRLENCNCISIFRQELPLYSNSKAMVYPGLIFILKRK